jgi:putative nucleotidyltransferase with HDIG domain
MKKSEERLIMSFFVREGTVMGFYEMYIEINSHLMEDKEPSVFFNGEFGQLRYRVYPFDMLTRLKDTPQSPDYHPEGSAWNHTMLVVDEAAKVKGKSKNPRVFMWAALLHDIGKPPTTRIRRGKITSYDHDRAGAELSKKFILALTDDEGFAHDVSVLVRYHMQILFAVKKLPFADIEGMRKNTDINEVALLGLCDRLGRTGSDREFEERNIKQFLKECSRNHRPA